MRLCEGGLRFLSFLDSGSGANTPESLPGGSWRLKLPLGKYGSKWEAAAVSSMPVCVATVVFRKNQLKALFCRMSWSGSGFGGSCDHWYALV